MALCIARCNRLIQSTALRRNVSIRIFHAKKHSLAPSAASTSSRRILTNDLEVSQLKLNYPENRTLHTSISLLKKFKESEYETLRVVDPNGQFICNAEMLILEKFCYRYNRFSFQEFNADNKDSSENGQSDGNLRVFQLLDKTKENPVERKETRTKLIKFHKGTAAEKMPKVWELLVDRGKVNITFDKEGTRAAAGVKKMLKEFKNVKIVSSPDNTVLFVSLNDIDFELLQSLFEDIRKQEAAHIAKVKEMLKTIGG